MAISAARVGGATRASASTELLCVLLIALGAACTERKPSGRDVTSSPGDERAFPGAEGALDLTPGPALRPTPLSSDPLWQRAQHGDPIDLARLAERESAAGLVIGLELGRTLALTALLALPYAEDGELALGRLCELTSHVAASQIEPVLRAVHGIVSRPPKAAERLDVQGAESCSVRLGELAVSERLSPASRDLAASARAMLAEHAQN